MNPAYPLLPAGDEIDGLIASQIMGWTWPANRCPVCGWPYDDCCSPGSCSMRPQPAITARERSVPHYSSDIATAFSVIEHFRARGYWFDLSSLVEGGEGPFWDAYLHERGIDLTSRSWEARAATIPLAICRVALLTLEEHA